MALFGARKKVILGLFVVLGIAFSGCNFLEVSVTMHQSARQVDSDLGDDDTVSLKRGSDISEDKDITKTMLNLPLK